MIYISFDIGIKNLALCILDKKDNNISIIDWRIISLAEKKKDVKGLNMISEILYIELDNIIGSLNTIGYDKIEKVIIENQPSNLNGIMKSIQLLIYSYFNLLKHWENKVDEVILINASIKLQNHKYIPSSRLNNDIDLKKLKRIEKYNMNKKDAIEICRYYIKDDKYLLEFFESNKKKDDLSDTLLQTISYIIKTDKIVIENVNKDMKNIF